MFKIRILVVPRKNIDLFDDLFAQMRRIKWQKLKTLLVKTGHQKWIEFYTDILNGPFGSIPGQSSFRIE